MVVLSAKILPQLRLTMDDYLQADLPERQRYELVDGVVEVSARPDELHDHAIMALCEALLIYRRAHPGTIDHISQKASVLIPGRQCVREPDLAAYRRFQRSGHWSAWKQDCPFWIAEATSPDQESRDLEEKREDYWNAGIDEYWILHREQSRVLVLNRAESAWSECVSHRGQDALSIILPGFSVPVASLFPQI